MQDAALEFIAESTCVFGVLPFIPNEEVRKALARVDYGSSFIIHRDILATIDPEGDIREELEQLDGTATVGGYAVDSLNNHEYRDVKRMFSSLNEGWGVLKNTGYLVDAVVSPGGIVPVRSIVLAEDTKLSASPDYLFTLYRNALKKDELARLERTKEIQARSRESLLAEATLFRS